jgi:CHAT domain-containing protein
MNLGESLPLVCSLSPRLEPTFDLDDDHVLGTVVDVVDDLLERAVSEGPIRVDEIAASLLAEVIASRQCHDHPAFDAIQLAIALGPLDMWVGIRRFDRAWYWAVAACSSEMPGEQEADLELDRPFRAAAQYPALAAPNLLRWGGQLCYLAWSAAYFIKEAEFVAPRIAAGMVEVLEFYPNEFAEPASHVASFLYRMHNPLAEPVVRALDRCSGRLHIQPFVRAQLACLLSGGLGEFTDVSPASRASAALDELGPVLVAHQRLQLMVATLVGDPGGIRSNLASFGDAIATHNKDLEQSELGPLAIRFARARLFSVLSPLIRTLAMDGDSDTCVRLLAEWSGVASDVAWRDPLIICARLEDHFVWIAQGRAIHTTPYATSMTEMLNSVLGLALVDTADMSPIASLPDRPGMPENKRANDFRDMSRAVLQPEKAIPLLVEGASECAGLLNLGFERIPLTHLIAESGGPSLPLTVSLEQPDSDRVIRRADIWWGDLLFAQEEAEAVASILRRDGVEVRVVAAAGEDARSFRESYADPDVDLLWIASHSAFGHWQPDATTLVVASNLRIGLEEFAGWPKPVAGRRLLVLNSCDSAAMTGLGGPSTVGLAGVAAGRTQAVVAHLWPVSWYNAAAFGLCLAAGLLNHGVFNDSFAFATRTLSSDNWKSHLTRIAPDPLLRRLGDEPVGRTFLDRTSAVLVQ